MDAELRDYLEGKFAALEQRIDNKITAMAQHILHEMDTRFSLVDKKLESIDSRLKLHAGLLQSGARAIARLTDYSETSEARWLDLVVRFDSLERRVNKLDPPAPQ